MYKHGLNAYPPFLFVLLAVNPLQGSALKNVSSVGSLHEDVLYFSVLPNDRKDPVAPPVITSSTRTSKADTFVLTWKPPDNINTVKCYKIRYTKEGATRWIYKTVSANSTRFTLTHLNASSLYDVEMVTVLMKDGFSQSSYSSFRTGSAKSSTGMNFDSPFYVSPSLNPSLSWQKKGRHSKKQSHKTFNNSTVKAPGAPDLRSVASTSATSVSLNWISRGNGGSPITGYKVQIRTSGNGRSRWKTRKTVSADTQTCVIKGLKRGTSYKFRVIAENAFGDSPPSQMSAAFDMASFRTKELTTAPRITNVTLSNGSILIEWEYDDVEPNLFQGFIFKYSVDERRKRKRFRRTDVFSYEIASLVHDKQYLVKLQAFNSKGNSPDSFAAKFKIVRNRDDKKDEIKFTNFRFPLRTSRNFNHERDRDVESVSPYVPVHNDNVKAAISQRDLSLICGAAGLLFVIIILAGLRVIYQKRKRKADTKRKQHRNTSRSSCKKPTLCSKLAGYLCCGEDMENVCQPVPSSPPPCSCYSGAGSPPRMNGSCLQSNRTSFSHSVVTEQGAIVPIFGVPGNQMYPMCCSPSGIPLWWVRGADGEFCHIVPNSAKPRPKQVEEDSENKTDENDDSEEATSSTSITQHSNSCTSERVEIDDGEDNDNSSTSLNVETE